MYKNILKPILACTGLVLLVFCPVGAAFEVISEDDSGIAAKYPADTGIEKDPAVVFVEDFESRGPSTFKEIWTSVSNKARALSIAADVPPASKGSRSLQVTAKRGKNSGGSLYKVIENGYDELYARIYVKFARDYGFNHHFCKLAGQIDPPPWPTGGAGLRPKKRFITGLEPTTALRHTYPPKNFAPPGFWFFYTYWPRMKSWENENGVPNNPPDGDGRSFYGNNFAPAEPTLVPRDRWICMEWMVRLNSEPGKCDGAQRFWIDGKLVGNWSPGTPQGYWMRDMFRIVPGDERCKPFSGFCWRDDPKVKINKFKLENYVSDRSFEHGDKYKAKHPDFPLNDNEYTCWFDHVVIATSYIGPIYQDKAKPTAQSADNILFTCDFESDTWYKEWDIDKKDKHTDVVTADPIRKFKPFRDKALRIKVDKGGHYGTSLQFRFKERLGEEPEEIYFRYYLRFADDWDPVKGGKLPGITGTYGRAGWGGRRVNGRDGWSARGLFDGQNNDKTPIGFYCYHVDMKGKYGSHWVWDKNNLGYLQNNRWYCVEQYAKMNTPGQNDGILRGWVNGQLAFEKTDVRMRDVDTLKIETIWVNLYLGGTWTAESDHHLYIDDVVIARNYIGPVQK